MIKRISKYKLLYSQASFDQAKSREKGVVELQRRKIGFFRGLNFEKIGVIE